MNTTLLTTINTLPKEPGVYQYFDKNNHLLYIGKAKNLSNRVRSYFKFTPELSPNPRNSQRIFHMIEQATSLNYIIVESEHDALILENSLIKQLNPKYNILLRDDKTFPYIYIDYAQKYPRFDITRKILKQKKSKQDIKYFGPYSIGARDILDSLYELCKLVQKKSCLQGSKACLYYQIEKCLAPCEFNISTEHYQNVLNEALNFIEHPKKITTALETKMFFYAESERFEEAGELRDRIERIKKSKLISNIDLANHDNYDIFAIESNEKKAVIVRLFMREGKIISSAHETLNLQRGFDLEEAYERALIEYYGREKPPIIAPILLAHSFENIELVSEHLSKLFEKKAVIMIPQRGSKKKLTELASKNALELLKIVPQNYDPMPIQIQELAKLENIPLRVEVFDNSHMAGVAPIGAMVTYTNGVFLKKDYRTYHLEARDEYHQMRETLLRRINSFEKLSPPDLWLLDGGQILLNLAYDLLQSAGVHIDLLALAKEKVDAKAHRAKGKANDILYSKTEVFKLQNSDKRLQWAQKLRDESHRAAITFHKKTKLKLDQQSQLLNLKGISQAKISKIIQHYGTFEELKNVSEEELTSLLNKKDAKTIKEVYF